MPQTKRLHLELEEIEEFDDERPHKKEKEEPRTGNEQLEAAESQFIGHIENSQLIESMAASQITDTEESSQPDEDTKETSTEKPSSPSHYIPGFFSAPSSSNSTPPPNPIAVIQSHQQENLASNKKQLLNIAYETINNINSSSYFGDYYICKEGAFIGLINVEKLKLPQQNDGWKFHVSLSDSDIAAGWKIVSALLIEYKVYTFKVIDQAYLYLLSGIQSGKQITIYSYNNNNVNWEKLFTKITCRLERAYIQPAPLPPNNRPISGSRYITYRNEFNLHKEYVAARKAVGYNQSGFPDPFLHIEVQESNYNQTQESDQSTQPFELTPSSSF